MRDSTRAALVETHVSAVLFWDDRAYKLKKPVKTPFLDFSTRLKRLEACRREVQLNRRMAPDVYLGVSDVIGPDGEVCDHMVVMRRMPVERRLSHLITDGKEVTEEIRKVARAIAEFHSRAERSSTISAGATRGAIEDRWQGNLTELEPYVGEVLNQHSYELIRTLSMDYIRGRGPLLEERVAGGFIRDCHGDLLADDIFCLDDGPRILDCIEFDDSFRYIDVIDDVATLAMDLVRLGAPNAAHNLLKFYREFSGENHPSSLEAHYVAYRALVRAKVACMRYEQGDQKSKKLARSLFDICARRLSDSEIRLVLIGGLPGTGKSTLAGALGDQTGWPVLRSDEVRRELVASAATEEEGYRRGIYSPAFTDRTYDALLERAHQLLGHGYSVIVDATWARSDLRQKAAEMAASSSARLIEFECRLDPEIAAERMRKRTRMGTDPSEATPQIAARMSSDFEIWPTAQPVDTDAPVGQLLPLGEKALSRRVHGGDEMKERLAILVVNPDPEILDEQRNAIRAHDMIPITCLGPDRTIGCPLLDGLGCPLRDQADVVVVELDLDVDDHAKALRGYVTDDRPQMIVLSGEERERWKSSCGKRTILGGPGDVERFLSILDLVFLSQSNEEVSR